MPETKSFLFENHPCRLVIPDAPAKGRPWVWRAEFFGAFDTVDRALLERGWYIAYCSLSDRYGCPSAVADMKRFHDHLVSAFGLCEKAALFGFSRGGLYAFNYSLLYPQDVAVLYLDAPVLDICSWPGGLGDAPRAEKEWRECLACYGLTEETVRESRVSPVWHLEELLGKNIPLVLIAGEKDGTVPFAENGARLLAARKAHSDENTRGLVILKKDGDHHPHSVDDPAQITRVAEWIAGFV